MRMRRLKVEPNYVADNGYIDAMAVAWLFDSDHVFFLENEITWDGDAHAIVGIQVNAANLDEAPVLKANYQQILSAVVDLLGRLEGDKELSVPRAAIHPGLHDAIREGDLTGITLFNLMACARALVVKQMEPGLYSVFHDDRLARGIPGFYRLVARMLWDMREYNDLSGSFRVTFAAVRNIDADKCFGSFEGIVEGAVSDGMHVESVDGRPDVGQVVAGGDAKGCSAAAKESSSKNAAAKGKGAKGKGAKGKAAKSSATKNAAPKDAAAKSEAGVDESESRCRGLDPDVLDKIAIAGLYAKEGIDAQWVCDALDEIESAQDARPYFEELIGDGVLKHPEEGVYQAATSYRAYESRRLDLREAQLSRERQYELLVDALLDSDEFVDIEELEGSVSGLPAHEELREHLYEGVRRGDLMRNGSLLEFACALDGAAKAAWKSGAKKRKADRKRIRKAIKAERAKLSKSQNGDGKDRRRFNEMKRKRNAITKMRAEEERRRQAEIDAADTKRVIDKIDGYRLGDGFVTPKWVKKHVPEIKSVKRAEELLEQCWEKQLVRRRRKSGSFVYARLVTDAQWDKIKEHETKVARAQQQMSAERHKREYLRELEAEARDASKEEASLVTKCRRRKVEYEAALDYELKCKEKVADADRKIRDIEGEAKRLEEELGTLGFFSFSKKDELRERIRRKREELVGSRIKKAEAEQVVREANHKTFCKKLDLESAQEELEDIREDIAEIECEKDDYEPLKPTDEDAAQLILRFADAWGLPFSVQWVKDNVPGMRDGGRVKAIMESQCGQALFKSVGSGMFIPR